MRLDGKVSVSIDGVLEVPKGQCFRVAVLYIVHIGAFL